MLRKSTSPVLTIVLMLVLVISIASGVWLVHSNISSQAKASSERDIEAAKDKISTSIAIESVKNNVVTVRNIGRERIRSIFVYIDGKPIDPLSSFQFLDAQQTAPVILPVAVTFGVHTLKIVADSIAQDQVKIGDKDTSLFKWRIPLTLSGVPGRDYKNIWAFGGGGRNLTIPRPIPLDSFAVLDENDLEVPSRISANWYDQSWSTRRPVMLKDLSGAGFSGEPAEITLSGLSLPSGSCNEIRITNEAGTLVPTQVVADETTSCRLLLPATVPKGAGAVYYAYYGNPNAPMMNYDTDLRTRTEENAVCLENGKISACMGLDVGGIVSISLHNGTNLLARNAGMGGRATGIAPLVRYKEGWDYQSCLPYAYKSHRMLENGQLKKSVEYVFGTKCGADKEYDYKYVVTMYAGMPFYDIEVSNINTLDFGGKSQAFLVQSNWASAWPSRDSVVVDGKYSAYWDSSNPSGAGIGTAAVYLSPRTVPGSIRPANFIYVDDSSSFPPSIISKMRTFLYPNSEKDSAVSSGFARLAPKSLEMTQGEKQFRPSKTEIVLDVLVSLERDSAKTVYLYYTDQYLGAIRGDFSIPSGGTGTVLSAKIGPEEPAAGNSTAARK